MFIAQALSVKRAANNSNRFVNVMVDPRSSGCCIRIFISMISREEKVNRLSPHAKIALKLPIECNRLKNDQSEEDLNTMKKITFIFLVYLGLTACSSENNMTSQQVVAQGGVNDGSDDPYYQLQEAEAKKHKDSAPPAN